MEYIRQPLDFSKKKHSRSGRIESKIFKPIILILYQMHWPERKMNMFQKRGVQELIPNGKTIF